jgi:hypothetical protein
MENKLAHLVWLGMKNDGDVCDDWEDFQVFCNWFLDQCPSKGTFFKVPGEYSPKSCWLHTVNKYNFYNPSGERVGSDNLSELCKANNLSYKSMLAVNNGSANTHKGWYKDIKNKPVVKVYHMCAPNHEYVQIDNLALHCRKYGLNYQSMMKVLNGSQQHHKGWYK